MLLVSAIHRQGQPHLGWHLEFEHLSGQSVAGVAAGVDARVAAGVVAAVDAGVDARVDAGVGAGT